LREHRIDLPFGPEETLAAVSDAAELWGAEWTRHGTGGRLRIPVTAGIRRGVVDARLSTEPADDGTRVVLFEEKTDYTLNASAFMLLLFGAAGGLVVALWPFWPPLLKLAPVAAVVALAAWLLVVSRLRTAGPEEFLEILRPPVEGDVFELENSTDEQSVEPPRAIEP